MTALTRGQYLNLFGPDFRCLSPSPEYMMSVLVFVSRDLKTLKLEELGLQPEGGVDRQSRTGLKCF